MGFQDSFSKDEGDKSNLQYDDTAFSYFFVAILTSIAVPMLISSIKPLIWNPTRQKLKAACQCQSCKKKVEKLYKKNKNNFATNFYKLKLILAVLMLIIAKKTYQSIDNEASNIKKFDPWDILEIQPNSEVSVIKKAFRALSRKYHPDIAKDDPEAMSKFILVGKAYECLTDEKKKETCLKYGNPDGPGKLNVAIAMPSFLLNKENHVAVLLVFFFILLFLLPLIGFCWYKDSGMKNEHGVLNTNKRGFYQRLNENLIIKNLPEILSQCEEYSQIPVNKEQSQCLSKIVKNFDGEYQFPKTLPQKFMTPFALICAHLQGQQIPKPLEDLFDKVIVQAPQLLQGMISFIMENPYFHRRLPPEMQGNLKFFGVQPMVKLIEFQQMMTQGLGQKSPDVFQLSYFRENPTEQRNKKLPKFTDLTSVPRDQRKLYFVSEEKDKAQINDELDHIPNINIDVFAGVEGEEQVTEADIFKIKVQIQRKNLKEKQQNKLIHAVNFPSFRNEKWHVIIASQNGEVKFYQLLSGNGNVLETAFQTMLPLGQLTFLLYVKSDSYRGYDIEQEIKVKVVDSRTIERKIEWHEEDIALENEPSLFNQMMQQMNPQNNDSEEEEEEEEENDKKPQQK